MKHKECDRLQRVKAGMIVTMTGSVYNRLHTAACIEWHMLSSRPSMVRAHSKQKHSNQVVVDVLFSLFAGIYKSDEEEDEAVSRDIMQSSRRVLSKRGACNALWSKNNPAQREVGSEG